jgi:hypothetical protein
MARLLVAKTAQVLLVLVLAAAVAGTAAAVGGEPRVLLKGQELTR